MPTDSIKIHYCTQCNWLSRASWMAQEILHTFFKDIHQLSLVPVDGGRFEVWFNEKLIFSRHEEAGFIDIKFIKQRLRDEIDPERSLGHSDR